MLLWFTKHQKSGRAIVTVGVLLLLIISCSNLPYKIIRPLETQYSVIDYRYAKVNKIVVLASDVSEDPSIPEQSRLELKQLYRLAIGVRLQKEALGRLLILSCAKDRKYQPVEYMAQALGVAKSRIIALPRVRDTEEEAAIMKPLLSNEPFFLVTSASHLPRAMALFKKRNMNPIPVPADYALAERHFSYLPNAETITTAQIVAYEYLGILFEKLTGKIS